MKFFLLAACILGSALCAPNQMYMEFDFRHAPVQAVQAAPAGAPVGNLDVILPVDAYNRPIVGPVQGFVKHKIPQPNGQESQEVFYPFGFNQPAPVAPVVPAAPVVPVAPVVHAAPVVPAAPVIHYVRVAPVAPAVAVVPARKRDDDDDDDDE